MTGAGEALGPCADLKHAILTEVEDVLKVQATDQGCLAVLPINDFLGEPVEVYVQETTGGYFVSDFGLLFSRFAEYGYDWGETPNDDRFDEIVERYNLTSNLNRGVFSELRSDDKSRIGKEIWCVGECVGEASQLLSLARTFFRYDFRRAFRGYLIEKSIAHRARPSYQTPTRAITFDFGIAPSEPILVDTLRATSPGQASSTIARVYQDFSVFKNARTKSATLQSKLLGVVYDDESEVAESPRLAELALVSDFDPVPVSAIDESMPNILALARVSHSSD